MPRRSFFHLVPSSSTLCLPGGKTFCAERRGPSGDAAAVGDGKQKVIVVAVVLNAAVVCCDLGKLTWNLKITCLKGKIIFQTCVRGFRGVGTVCCVLFREKTPICRIFLFLCGKNGAGRIMPSCLFDCHRTIPS